MLFWLLNIYTRGDTVLAENGPELPGSLNHPSLEGPISEEQPRFSLKWNQIIAANACVWMCVHTPRKTPSGAHDRKRQGERPSCSTPLPSPPTHTPPPENSDTEKNLWASLCVCVWVRHCCIFHVADNPRSNHPRHQIASLDDADLSDIVSVIFLRQTLSKPEWNNHQGSQTYQS